MAVVNKAKDQERVNLELTRISRYFYNNTLYVKNTVYVFDKESATKVLRVVDPAGLPVFGLAKPRTKLVQIPLEAQTVSLKSTTDEIEIDFKGNPVGPVTPVSPLGKLDLGDDDPEIQAKLAKVDAELIDTGMAVAV